MTTRNAQEARSSSNAIGPGTIAVIAIVVLLLLWLFAQAVLGWNAGGFLSGLRGARDMGPSVSEITLNPGAYYGKSVTLRASVSRVIDGRALVLTTMYAPHESELLAVAPAGRSLPPGIDEQEWVVVQGTITRFVPAQWDLGTGAAAQTLLEWADRPALVVESVAPITR